MATHTTHDHPLHLASIPAMDAHLHSAVLAIGRILFGGFFLFNAFDHFANTAELAGYAAAQHVPDPHVAVLATGTLLLFGGLSILTGVWPRVGAGLIIIFLLGVTPVMHAFWNDPAGAARAADIANFTKNIALIGGACFVAAFPRPWPGSLR